MKPRVYVETSVISYLTARPSRDLVRAAHQELTFEWWAKRNQYEPVVSNLVIAEAARGDGQAAQLRLASLADLMVLEFSEEARELSLRLIERLALPAKAADDAYHVAVAAVYGLDFLATWNCTHIANPVTRSRIEMVCRDCGYEPALIGTPEELLATLEE